MGRKIIGGASILIGLASILNSLSGITGFAIAEDVGTTPSFIFGLILFLGGLGLFIPRGRMMEEGELERSIREAVDGGVPLKEAKKIFDESNRKVESGEWIELGKITVTSTSNPARHHYATSLCRYWGPSKYLGSNNSRLDKLYEAGEVGKTHELVVGSDKYKLGGRLSTGTLSLPEKGSAVEERHWEIKEAYHHKSKRLAKSP